MQPTAFIPCHCFAEKILKNRSSTVNIQLIIHNSTEMAATILKNGSFAWYMTSLCSSDL